MNHVIQWTIISQHVFKVSATRMRTISDGRATGQLQLVHNVLFKVEPSLQVFSQSSMSRIFVLYMHCCITPQIFRSTPPSRPNNIRRGNFRLSVGTSVCLYVHPQKVCPISMKFGMYMEVDEWCMMVCCMTRFKVKVMSRGLWSSENCTFQSLSPLPLTEGAGKWPLILKLEHNI